MSRSRSTVQFSMRGRLQYTVSADAGLPAPCVAIRRDGTVCGLEPIGGGAPVDLCPEHALATFRHLQDLITEAPFHDVDAVADMNARRFEPGKRGRATEYVPDHMNGWPAVVYYISAGSHVKIGTSRRLRSRLRDYPPCTRLLALEPGGPEVERERHNEFIEYRVTREWFDPGIELMTHIRLLAEKGLPPGPLVPAADRPLRTG